MHTFIIVMLVWAHVASNNWFPSCNHCLLWLIFAMRVDNLLVRNHWDATANQEAIQVHLRGLCPGTQQTALVLANGPVVPLGQIINGRQAQFLALGFGNGDLHPRPTWSSWRKKKISKHCVFQLHLFAQFCRMTRLNDLRRHVASKPILVNCRNIIKRSFSRIVMWVLSKSKADFYQKAACTAAKRECCLLRWLQTGLPGPRKQPFVNLADAFPKHIAQWVLFVASG